jgi:hypothetical protein
LLGEQEVRLYAINYFSLVRASGWYLLQVSSSIWEGENIMSHSTIDVFFYYISMTLELISKTLNFTTLFTPLMIPWAKKWSGEEKLDDQDYRGVPKSSGPHAYV